MFTSRNATFRRTAIAVAAIATIGAGAGAVSASDEGPLDLPVEWPDPVKQRATTAESYCADPAAAAAAGYNVIVGAGAIVGTVNDDLILASGMADTIDALEGHDIVCAFGQNDRARGGPGNDVVLGQPGNDRLQGNAGNDILIGGLGADLCDGGAGVDFVDC